MNALAKTFPLHHARSQQSTSRSLWHDSRVGLGIGLVVLMMAIAQVMVNPGVQTVPSLPGAAESSPLIGWENKSAPEWLPLSPLTTDALR